jgi:hypothetical protein
VVWVTREALRVRRERIERRAQSRPENRRHVVAGAPGVVTMGSIDGALDETADPRRAFSPASSSIVPR